jgi:hypothetical protein
MEGRQFRKKDPVLSATIISAAAIAGIVCMVFAENIAKRAVPAYYALNALSALMDGLPDEFGSSEVHQLFAGQWRADASVRVEDMSPGKPGYMQWIDESAVRLFGMLETDASLSVAPRGERASASVGLEMNGEPLLDIDLWASQDSFAAKLHQLADYFIAANPKEFASDWNKSAFSGIKEIEGEDSNRRIYQGYMSFLETVPSNIERLTRPWNHGLSGSALIEGAKCSYAGSRLLQAPWGEAVADVYKVAISAESANKWWNDAAASLSSRYKSDASWNEVGAFLSLLEMFTFHSDLDLMVNIVDGRICTIEAAASASGFESIKAVLSLKEKNDFSNISFSLDLQGIKSFFIEASKVESISEAAYEFSVIERGAENRESKLKVLKSGESLDCSLYLVDGKDGETVETAIGIEAEMAYAGGALELDVPSLLIEKIESGGEMFANLSGSLKVAQVEDPLPSKPSEAIWIYDIWNGQLLEMQETILENEALFRVLNNDF